MFKIIKQLRRRETLFPTPVVKYHEGQIWADIDALRRKIEEHNCTTTPKVECKCVEWQKRVIQLEAKVN